MKTLQPFLFVIAALLISLSIGCGDDDDNNGTNPQDCLDGTGSVVSRDLDLPLPIRGFDSGIAADIILTQGSPQVVRIEGQENIINNIEFVVNEEVLTLDFDQCVSNIEDLTLFITLSNLEVANVRGVGDISSTNSFTGLNNLEIDFLGAGSIDLDLEAVQITSQVNGVGDVSLSGTVVDQFISLTGVGNFLGFDLESENCTVNLTGTGNAEVFASESLDVTITGVGNVSFKGDPEITSTITGIGRLIDAN